MGKKIVLAEDEEHIAKMVVYKLKKEGYEVRHFTDGQQALAGIRGDKPDLILLDVMMPIMDGFEALKELKSDEELKSIPVVMLTAMGQESDTVKGFDLGAIDYITKPFRPAEMVVRVKRILH